MNTQEGSNMTHGWQRYALSFAGYLLYSAVVIGMVTLAHFSSVTEMMLAFGGGFLYARIDRLVMEAA